MKKREFFLCLFWGATALAAELLFEKASLFSRVPGFFFFFGFVGCLLIVFFSKAFGKAGIQRPLEEKPR